jgi:predicted ATPase
MDLGRFSDAAGHLRRAIELHDGADRHAQAYVIDPGVACRAYLGRVQWVMGLPDQALASAEAAVALARRLPSPHSLALALTFAAIVHHLRLEPEQTLARAEEAEGLSRAQGMAQTLAFACMWRGWALTRLGRADAGVAALREGLTSTRALGSEIARPLFLARLAEALADRKQVDEGLGLLGEALAAVARTGEGHDEAELHRLRGRLLAQRGGAADESEAATRRALAIARGQQALGWELRAAQDLARHPSESVAAEGRRAIASALARFSEGAETVDIRTARALVAGG